MRVLLLDEGFISGTVTARGLQRAGCSVDVIAATGGRGRCIVGENSWRLGPRVGDPRLIDIIDAAARRSEYDIIYPITEPLQWLIWDERPAWEKLVFPTVEYRQRAARRDKRRMSELVAAAGITTPRQVPITSEADVDLAARDLGLPLVIKGTTGRGGNATHICASLDAARAAANRLISRGCVPFAQAYVAGITYLAGGLFDAGRALRFYAGAKTLQYPSRVGPAAEITSVNDPALTALATRVFAAANVSGIASIDLVRSATGQFHFLELNPRPWGSIEAALDAGLDIFDALARLWRSEPVCPQLDFQQNVRTPIFPLYMFAVPYWRSGGAPRALLPDVRRALTLAHDEPTLASHIMHRLVRVGLNWNPTSFPSDLKTS